MAAAAVASPNAFAQSALPRIWPTTKVPISRRSQIPTGRVGGVVHRLPDPSNAAGSQASLLLEYLDFYRERILTKFHALQETERRTSRLASGWEPIELVQHLRHVERRWLEWGYVDPDLSEPWADDSDGRWHVPPDLSDLEVVEGLRAQGRRSREIVETIGPGASGIPGDRWGCAKPATVERVLLHLVQEYARHLGQLDVVAEICIGVVGE